MLGCTMRGLGAPAHSLRSKGAMAATHTSCHARTCSKNASCHAPHVLQLKLDSCPWDCDHPAMQHYTLSNLMVHPAFALRNTKIAMPFCAAASEAASLVPWLSSMQVLQAWGERQPAKPCRDCCSWTPQALLRLSGVCSLCPAPQVDHCALHPGVPMCEKPLVAQPICIGDPYPQPSLL